jgi:hypothetical protein
MNSSEVRETVRLLPRDAPVYRPDPNRTRRRNAKEDGMRTAERWAEGMTSPNWGWKVALRHFQERKPLPANVQNIPIRRAYYFLRGQEDENMAVAVSLYLPHSADRRIVLEGFICARDITLTGIAHVLGLEPDVVELYEALFLNVRGRERLHLAAAVFPSTRLLAIRDAERGPRLIGPLMRQTGRDFGWKAVARMAGIIPVADDRPAEQQIEELERHIAGNALMLAQAGYLNRPSTGLQHARSLIARRQEREVDMDDDARRGLAGMSLAVSVNESFNRMMQPEIERRLAAQRGIESDWQSKAAANESAA